MKSKSDNRFLEFIKGTPAAMKIGILLLFAVALIFLSSLFSEGAGGAESDSLEQALIEMCASVEGVGECEVMITYRGDDKNEIYAVAILCEGADSVNVRADLTELVGSLFGIGANRIAILKIEK